MSAADPVVAACTFHGLVPLIQQDDDGVVVIRLDHGAITLMRIPRIGRHLAQPNHVATQVIRQRLERVAVRRCIERACMWLGRHRAILVLDHGHDLLPVTLRLRCLVREDLDVLLELRAHVPVCRSRKPPGSHRYTGNLVLDDQRGWLVNAFDLLHGIPTHVEWPVIAVQPRRPASHTASAKQPSCAPGGSQFVDHRPISQRRVGSDLHRGTHHR